MTSSPSDLHEGRITVNALSFEVLDAVFSYYSTPGGLPRSTGAPQAIVGEAGNPYYSYYEAQQDLLNFCMVNKQFYQAAR
jgi:hypothetical protein